MADFKSDEIYLIEMYSRHQRASAYVDLLVVDYQQSHRTVYLANLIGSDAKVHQVVDAMNDFKTGQVRRAEGNPYDRGHMRFDIVMPDRNCFDTFETKIEDLTNILVVAKCAKPNVKARQDWHREEEARRAQGLPPRRPPEELILAWDGDIEKQIFKILNDRYNTPMLEEWADYIVQQCRELGYYRDLQVHCYGSDYPLKAGLLQITEQELENIITEGIQSLELNFALLDDGRSEEESVLKDCNSLDTYLSHFAGALGERIQENSQIRFDPTKEKHSPAFYDVNLHANKNGVTGLFPPQADVVMGVAKTLKDDKYCFIVGEMGTGKTAMGAVVPYITEHVMKGKVEPYRALVFVPGIMVEKWKREIQERVPGAKVYEITSWRDVLKMEKMPYRPQEIEYWVMSSDVAKASYPMEPIQDWRYSVEEAKLRKAQGEKVKIRLKKATQYNLDTGREEEIAVSSVTGFHCPQCGGVLMARKNEVAGEHFFQSKRNGQWLNTMKAENYKCRNRVRTADLPKHMVKDPSQPEQECGFVLWRPALLRKDSLNRKVSPAWMINKRLRRGFFKYLIADEVHEYKSGETDRAKAFGQLVNHTEKQILLTGTLLGGMASDIFYLLARLDPKRLKRESITYDDLSVFIERYGVYEHTYQQRYLHNGQPITGRKKSGMRERAGVSPHVFSRYLISNCAFVELADLGYALPPYREEPVFVEMDEQHFAAYKQLEGEIGGIMRQHVFLTGGMRHVSTYINTLYQYSDMPWNWGPITYEDENGRVHVLATPANFDPASFTPTKYRALTDLLDDQIHRRGRKVLVYCRFTGPNGVDTYLYHKLKADGYNVGILKSSGVYDGIKMPKQEEREAWLREMMEKHNWDVLITNPRLVAVGLDLLMFPTIVYYQMDYSTYNYMQSSRRSWRIKQTQPVEVYTLVYRNTIQADVLDHIARKIDAALALQGKFSEEGLRAMADSGDGITALAKKLVNEGTLNDVSSIEDRWKRINATYEELQNAKFEGYDGYEMNPLGIEEVRRIQQGIVKKMEEDVAAGRISALDLADYLAHIEEMFTMAQTVPAGGKRKKKEKVAEGQFELALF